MIPVHSPYIVAIHCTSRLYTILSEDYSTDKEESEEEDPVQLNMEETELSEEEQTGETKLNEQEKKVTFKMK